MESRTVGALGHHGTPSAHLRLSKLPKGSAAAGEDGLAQSLILIAIIQSDSAVPVAIPSMNENMSPSLMSAPR
jgi:hypothetical protein